MTTTDWPYDALEHDPLTALRIPVTTSNPQWYYTIALNLVPVSPFDAPMQRPDERETALLVSYLEFQLSRLREGYRTQLLERPFDIGVNNATRIFRKWAPGDWSWRLSSWTYGYSPQAPRIRKPRQDDGPLSLAQALDRAEYSDGRNGDPNTLWLAWKDTHPEVFTDA